MRVIQLLTTLTYGDAVGNDSLALDEVLKKAGYKTGIYAERLSFIKELTMPSSCLGI